MIEIHSDQLVDLISRSEGPKLEYKSADTLTNPDHDNRKKIAQNLVAFANREGGKLIFGIDDETRQPEGELIREEEAIGTISEISRMNCSPTVYFSHDFFSREKGDLSEGSVFVLNIRQEGDIPHARVIRSGDEIEKREYRLRAGDETRLVSDQELKSLFASGSFESKIQENFSTFQATIQGDLTAYPRDFQRPTGVENSYMVYQGMNQEDQETILNQPSRGEFDTIMIGYAFLLQFARRYSNSWLIEMESYPGRMEWKFEDDVPMTQIGVDEINTSNKNSPLEPLDFDPMDNFEHFVHDGFAVPEGAEVTVSWDRPRARIEITNGEIFSIEIIFRMSNWKRGAPAGHPAYYSDSERLQSTEIVIEFTAEFGFPDVRDEYYEQHRRYAESIVEMLRKEWDADTFYENLPDKKLFEIESKIDQILARDVFGFNRIQPESMDGFGQDEDEED